MALLLVCIIGAAIFSWIKLHAVYQYWTKKGVIQIKTWPLVGNLGPIVFRTKSFTEIVEYVYNEFPQKRYCGIYRFLKPTLVIRCPELLKTVLVKEFATFPQHLSTIPSDADPIFSNNLFLMDGGQRWHDLRATLSPSFTGRKLRHMFELVQQCATHFTDHFEKHDGRIIIEMKNIFSRYTTDVIGSTAFGVTCNSIQNPNNKFYLIGKDISDITAWKIFKMLLICIINPTLLKILKIRILSKGTDNYFRSIISETIKLREVNKTIRPDMIHLLMEARKLKPEIVLTDEDITAQAFVFFVGGFETSGTTMAFTSYELALNLNIQKKLQDEIDDVLQSGELTLEKLFDMKYMDMVISESLRKWPPIVLSTRKSIKPFVFDAEEPGEKSLHLDSNTDLWIPIFGLHRDPKYFPEPDQFDPERFNDSNKYNINPFTYIPFGAGPKNCIGSRFALLQVKLILFQILSKYNINVTEKTPIPLVLDRSRFFLTPLGGLWLELNPRK